MAKTPTKGSFKAKALLIDMKPTAYNTRFRANALYDVVDKINTDGLPLLLVHDSGKLPVGAWYEAAVENDAVLTKFFIPKEVAEHDDVKTRIEADILDSVSIGFNAGIHDCSICGNDIQDYDNCSHIPGQIYDIKDPVDGASLGTETCYVMLDNVKASEASLVYSGAVPKAKIIEASDKADYFTQNKLNFATGSLETIHAGKFVQDLNVNNNNSEGEKMKKEFDDLTVKHTALTTKFEDVNEKYTTLREDTIALKELNLEYKEKVDGFDTAIEAKDLAETAYSEAVTGLTTQVEGLAAPFEAEYKAPNSIGALLADLSKFVEQAKSLPAGQQSHGEDELKYSEPDDTFKI